MKEYPFQFLVFLTVYLTFSQTAYAHSPGPFLFTGLSILVLAAFIAAFVKTFAVCRILKISENFETQTFLVVAALEVLIMVLVAFPLSFYLTESRHTLALLFTACIIYSLLALFPNFIFLRDFRQEAGKEYDKRIVLSYSFCISLIFPALMLMLVLAFSGIVFEFFAG